MALALRQPRKRLNVYPQALSSRMPLKVYPDSGEDERYTITPETLFGFKKFEPITIMLAGRRGHGKTSVMTALGRLFQLAYTEHGINVRIATNYNTDVATPGPRPDGGSWASPEILFDLMEYPWWADDMLVLIDEVATAFPRRRAGARINLDMSTFLQQIRKRDTELIFTTQFPGMLDDQLLINIDLYCMVNLWPAGGTAPFTNVTIAVWDWHGQWTGRFSRPRIPPDGPPTKVFTVYNVHNIFGHYNTNEVIAPMWSTSKQRDTIAGQSWDADAPESQAVIPTPQIAPTDLSSFLYSLGKSWNILRNLPGARHFDPTIIDQKDLIERIEALGFWEILTNHSQKAARLKE